MLYRTLSLVEKVWIFQCDPKKYRIKEALLDDEVKNAFHWKVKQHETEIAKGHIGLMWCAGKSAGIIAITEMLSDPGEFIESDAEKKYWIDSTNEDGVQFRVKMKVLEILKEPLTKERIKGTNGLQELSIVKMPRGTNFPVTKEEWNIIIELIEN